MEHRSHPGPFMMPKPSTCPEILPGRKKRFVKQLLNWFNQASRPLPWRGTKDPYAIWISEVMLQQTRVATVIPYWKAWMNRYPTVESLAAAPPEEVLKSWEGLGYYSRARNLHLAAQEVCKKHGGRFPRRVQALCQFPGIGRYTAGAIASIAFDEPAPLVDGNVARVLARQFGIAANPKKSGEQKAFWELAEDLVTHYAPAHPGAFNQALMELGATVCLPSQPLCRQCPVQKQCTARTENRISELPISPKRPGLEQLRYLVFLIQWKDQYLVVQRPQSGRNAGLWEFPNIDVTAVKNPRPYRLAQTHFNLHDQWRRMSTLNHHITRYRIHLTIVRGDRWTSNPCVSVDGPARWGCLNELQKLAFPSAHRRILQMLP